MVDHEIDQHPDAALLGGMGEFDKIAQRAIARIDTVIIGDVVPVVALRRYLKRHQPDRGDPQPVQIIETPHQPGEIADPVAIGIHIGADRQAVEDRVLVPEVVDHGGPARKLTLGKHAGRPPVRVIGPMPLPPRGHTPPMWSTRPLPDGVRAGGCAGTGRLRRRV